MTTWQQTLSALDDTIGGRPRFSISESTKPHTFPAGEAVTLRDNTRVVFLADVAVELTYREFASSGGTPPRSAGIGTQIRARLLYVGRLYDKVESTEHAAWRRALAATLRDADTEARNLDGKPPTAIDEANPLASKSLVLSRLQVLPSSPLIVDLRVLVRQLDGSGEPQRYGEGQPDEFLGARITRGLRPGTLEVVQAIEQDARDWIAFAVAESLP